MLLVVAAVGDLRPEYLPITERDVTPERLALFESFTGNVGTTIRSEYLPAGVEPGVRASAVTLQRGKRPLPKVLEGDLGRAILEERDAQSEHWRVFVSSKQAHLAFYTLFFPGWRALVDDEPVAIEPQPNSGLISLRVPQGEHVVTLRFGRSKVRRVADLVSLAALLTIAALLAPDVWAYIGRSWQQGVLVCTLGCLCLGVLAVAGWAFSFSVKQPPQNDLSMDFDRLPFLHHNPEGIDYGGVTLLAYDYADQVRGGSVLTASLRWAIERPQTGGWAVELQLVSPADPLNLAPLPPPLARSRARLESTTVTHHLNVPEDIASGPYYVALRVYSGPGTHPVRAVNARGETLGTTYLRPVWVDNPHPAGEGEALWARYGDRIVLRDNVHVEATDAHWNVQLTWQATAPVTANYTLSVHALDADGRSLAQRDWAEGPGYGFWPTSAWPVGEWLTDRLRLAVPDGVTAEDAVAMSVVLYDRSQPGYPALGTAVVPLGERKFADIEPAMGQRVEATFGERAVLLGYDLLPLSAGQETMSLRLDLYWRALPWDVERGNPPPDYVVFCHLYDPESNEIVVQSDARPLRGTYPTNAWQAGQVIDDEIALPLSGVPAGVYRLAVGMYEANSRDRTAIITAAGELVPDERLILEDRIEVPPK